MNRRNFLTGLGALVGGLAIEQAIPLGRVWSFPSKIVAARNPFDFREHYDRANRRAFILLEKMQREEMEFLNGLYSMPIEGMITIRKPERYTVFSRT